MARVLVTGATGFIGSHVADHFARAGHEVRALVRPASPRRGKLAGKPVEIADGDLLEPASLEAACRDREIVVNCAGLVTDWAPAREFWKLNVRGVANLCRAALVAGARRFVHLSTNDVFGLVEGKTIDESSPLSAWGEPYPDSKAAGERIIRAYGGRGLAVAILYPCWVYGEGDTTFLPELAKAIRTGELFFWRRRSLVWPCYVGNLTSLVERAALDVRAAGGGFLVHDGEAFTFQAFAALVAGALGAKAPKLRLPYALAYAAALASEAAWRIGRMKTRPLLTTYTVRNFGSRLRFSRERAARELEFIPPFTFAEGWARTVPWLVSLFPRKSHTRN
jgi:nucleoside-diphosphate-sugar epimerase